jgi:hypothetical protein
MKEVTVNARFEVFSAVKIQVGVFWFVMPCSGRVGYHIILYDFQPMTGSSSFL